MGVGGIFRELMTIPFLLELARDMEELCVEALLLNYTNLLGILMEVLYTAHPDLKSVGLCHSVPYTAREIASYIGVGHEDLLYECARRKLLAGEEFTLDRSVEYGSLIVHSITLGEARVVYGDVKNTGLITNLSQGRCVEVPVLVDSTGLHPCHVGDLPPQCAATCAPHTAVQNLTVRAALEGRRDHVHHAAMLDHHAPSVLSLAEISAMVDELIQAHENAMPEGIRAAGVGRGGA